MNNIEFDFPEVKAQEQKLRGIAARLEQMAKGPYSDIVEGLRQGWQSENSRKFMGKSKLQEEKLLGTGSAIRQTAQLLQETCVKVKQMEERAALIAENREKV